MREINIKSFELFELDAAIWWLEDEINHFLSEGHRDVKGEISLIDSKWRCSVISNTRQMEFMFEEI